MKKSITLLLSFVILLMQSCGNDDTPTPETFIEISDLVGSWGATSLVHTNKADNSQTFDVTENGGVVNYTMLDGGRTRIWVQFGGVNDEWDALATLNANVLTTTPAESTRPTTITEIVMDGPNAFIQTNRNDSFDFTLNGGTPVATISVIRWERR